jgi:hypothetical protein
MEFQYTNHMKRIEQERIVASNYDAKEGGDLTRVVVFWDTSRSNHIKRGGGDGKAKGKEGW